MSGFKLLAIRPIKIEEKKYLKLIKENKIYQFYSDYTFLNKENTPVNEGEVIESISFNPSSPDTLYSNENISINISAIVGKNGSGKSTLIDLLFLALYNLSVKFEILTSVENDDDIQVNLEIIKGIHLEIYYCIENNFYCLSLNEISQPVFKLVKPKSLELDRDLKISQFFDEHFEVMKNHFFYTISINYSIYGLNSKIMGLWIKSLFHKNDGYQTPIVINPYRYKGNYNINTELYLAKQRLLSNILIPNLEDNNFHLNLTENQKADYLTFSLNIDKVKYVFSRGGEDKITFKDFFEIEDRTQILNKIFAAFHNDSVRSINVKFREEVENYVIKKVVQIARTYKEYRGFFRDELEVHIGEHGGTKTNAIKYSNYFIEIDQYLLLLKEDNSHLTFKLRQALNYLKTDILIDDDNETSWEKVTNEDNEIDSYTISILELSKRLEKYVPNQEKLIEFIPPAIFDIELILIDSNNSSSKFSELSSGEQQLIHSIQSIIYHAVNVNSVFMGNKKNDKLTYNFLNIILDEVELYFHPEFQRKFVKELIDALLRVNLSKIKKFNVVFSTHSPFILSDIPSQNILKLDKGNPILNNSDQTFGSNIHDLLANDFFLDNGFMGEFAKEKINDIINWLNHEIIDFKCKKMVEKKSLLEEGSLEMKELSEKIEKIRNQKESLNPKSLFLNKSLCKEIISIIGEPVLKDKLSSMLYEISIDDDEIKYMKEIEDVKKKYGKI